MTEVVGTVLMAILLIIVFYVLLCIAKLIMVFHARRCKYCDHIMIYKSSKEENGETFYTFHCEHCGSWEKIPEEELFEDEQEIKQ